MRFEATFLGVNDHPVVIYLAVTEPMLKKQKHAKKKKGKKKEEKKNDAVGLKVNKNEAEKPRFSLPVCTYIGL